MHIDVLVAEIGSTTTVFNAFDQLDSEQPVFLGQGQARTTVEEGDVSIGLRLALESLKDNLGVSELSWGQMLASSSAAGGLRMTVHGLVYDMTVRAAREACLGSGAVIKQVTAGKLRPSEIKKIGELKPNIVFVAGGTDYGEWETALHNTEAIMRACPDLPIIYAGNVSNQDDVKALAEEYGVEVHLTENVYPSLDELNIEPARRLIHEVFQKHIIHSPGMEHIRDMVDGPILPTPGAVMEAAILLADNIGDLVVMDIGGATTDIHSVTDGNPNNIEYLLNTEPRAKRTVEGDLGVFVNREHIYEQFTEAEKLIYRDQVEGHLAALPKIPQTPAELELASLLAKKAAKVAMSRHVGIWTEIFTISGMQRFIKGKDLSVIKYAIATGGALTRLPQGGSLLEDLFRSPQAKYLLPGDMPRIFIDRDYIMASLGVLAKTRPAAALRLLQDSLDYK